MGLFAAGNDLVTLILALIPVAVFVLSNLYKAFAKANPVPAKGAPPAPPQGGKPNPPPRVMDLEAFLREAKKQGSGKQPNRPNPASQKNQGDRSERQKSGPVSPVFAERVTTPQNPPPRPPQKQRGNNPSNASNNPPKGQKKQHQGQQSFPPVIQGNQPSYMASLNALSLNLAPARTIHSIEENPVGIALTLLRKPHGGAGAFVLQEILGKPRCHTPHRPV